MQGAKLSLSKQEKFYKMAKQPVVLYVGMVMDASMSQMLALPLQNFELVK